MINIVSLKEHFLAWASAVQKSPPEERALLFMREVIAPNEAYYGALLFDEVPEPARRLKLTAAGSAEYYEKRAELSEAFDYTAAALRQFSGRFLGMFPEAPQDITLVVMPSLGRFDGRERFGAGTAFAGFGVEFFCAGGGREKELPLTAAHELFHLYHGLKSGIWQTPQKTVLTWLWADGLAVYASKLLCPGATDGDALADGALAQACRASYKDLYKVVAPALLSTAAEDQRALFNGGRHYKGLPSRAGYGLGLVAAEQLAEKGFSINEMSAWNEERASAELRSVFSRW